MTSAHLPKSSSPSIAEIQLTISNRSRVDNFAWIREATDSHRSQHHCWAYPYTDGTIMGAIAAALAPRKVLELGTGLGYTACWWAQAGASVTTVEGDMVHVELARENISTADLDRLVTIEYGQFLETMSNMSPEYDLIFFDGYEPSTELLLGVQRLLQPDGALVLTNLDLGSASFRGILEDQTGWKTVFLEDLAVCRRVRKTPR